MRRGGAAVHVREPRGGRSARISAEHWTSSDTFWHDHIHPEDREWVLAFCAAKARQLAPYYFEYRMTHADGRTVWVGDAVQVIEKDGKPVELTGVLFDVSDRRRAEAEERERSQMMALVLSEAPDLILGVSVGGAVSFANRVPEADRLAGTNLWDHIALADQAALREAIRLATLRQETTDAVVTFEGAVARWADARSG
jgi:PAS domain-containing protein